MLIRELCCPKPGAAQNQFGNTRLAGLLPPPPRGLITIATTLGRDIDRFASHCRARRLGTSPPGYWHDPRGPRAAGEAPCGHVLTILADQSWRSIGV